MWRLVRELVKQPLVAYRVEAGAEGEEVVSPLPTPDQLLEYKRYDAAFRDVARHISDGEWLAQAHVQGWTMEEMAQELGISTSTAQDRVEKIRKRFLKRLPELQDRIRQVGALLLYIGRLGLRGEAHVRTRGAVNLEIISVPGGQPRARLSRMGAPHLALLGVTRERAVALLGYSPVSHEGELVAKVSTKVHRVIGVAAGQIDLSGTQPDHREMIEVLKPSSSAEAQEMILMSFWLDVCEAIEDLLHYPLSFIEHSLPSGFWEMGERWIIQLRPDQFRRQEEPLPRPTLEVSQFLDEAAEAGQGDRVAEAGRLYRRALEEAERHGDVGGEVAATCGLSIALRNQEFREAASLLLQQLSYRHPLDEERWLWVMMDQILNFLEEHRVSRAQEWMSAIPKSLFQTRPNLLAYQIQASLIQEDWSSALQAASLHSEALAKRLPHLQRILNTRLLIAHANASPDKTFEEFYVKVRSEQEALPVEQRVLDWPAAELVSRRRRGDADPWKGIAQLFEAQLHREVEGRILKQWQIQPLRQLFIRAMRNGRYEQARHLLRFRWLSSDALASSTPLFASIESSDGAFLMGAGGKISTLTESEREELRRLIRDARTEVQNNQLGIACQTLGQQLFPVPMTGLFWVEGNGLLQDVPWFAIHHAAWPHDPLPAFRVLVGQRMKRIYEPLREPLDTVASLADPHPTFPPLALPGADAEVRPEQAVVHLRGLEVTRDALKTLPPVGLVVLGVHTQMNARGRHLLLADGPMYPEEIAADNWVQGSPVYILSACSGALYRVSEGTPQTLPDAFLRAGAAAVVAYQWPIEDRATRRATELLLQGWPHSEPEWWISNAVDKLIKNGEPAHIWGGISLY
ncbi:MAG: CHAT domain-containing protein [Myxococcota bacterium]